MIRKFSPPWQRGHSEAEWVGHSGPKDKEGVGPMGWLTLFSPLVQPSPHPQTDAAHICGRSPPCPTPTLALANSLETHSQTCPGVSLDLLGDSKSSQVDNGKGKQSQWPYLPPNKHGGPIPVSMIISALRAQVSRTSGNIIPPHI